MKLTTLISLLALFMIAVTTFAAPIPTSRPPSCGASCVDQAPASSMGHGAVVHMSKRQSAGPVLPLPAPGETLLSYLDRLLSGLPLLGKLLEGLGYVRPKQA
ncbi:hypothetical protein IWW55_000488 [Coemansia sp. RSA 2706]|nr:hypothetical protein LPJ63_004394 [Coemansia sp. RSA 2711]KAJ2308361.1 hypothetical protein IWW55_000488 [Coemansia sp. RSA 2706]KAJ2310860.1 hypothetical protein IWW54_002959 [Coemansia sp. RSA 2705]KAJ2321265.1 hypothetical protein IWW52_000847 [Coemansia sp. RSA 2704]KAJ2330155.1 hypothetical protein IWW51_000103 [Coemansia sp. RSA 2702]KAJ2368971.1 hypothetical protein H4S01_001288 [Coemansia sp. RSA 2610]KAJ2389514.1 hypothetical protein H4S02_002324 [Coemansia sp. RSA 2611]KAJ273403